ncbi:MAG: septation protein IspZ [Polyangiaceae bacterium]|nr:septation protein IspZ [Polyangiaceae bacterium]
MQTILELAPLVAFLAAYYAAGLYVATAVLMAAMLAVLVIDWARTRRIPPLHGLSAVLVLAFGSATLLLRDQRFIQWKPTVFFWVLAVAFLLSQWIGRRPLVQRLMELALSQGLTVPPPLWRRMNLAWVGFYALLGAANLAVAFNASEQTWVNFKVFGLTLITMVFVAVQVMWLARRLPAQSES